MPLTVRTGNAADMQAALPLLLERLAERARYDPAYFGLKPDAAKRFWQWLGPALEDPRHGLFVAEEDGKLVGCLAAIVERDLPMYEVEEYVSVRMLWVAPDRRGQGIAGRLLERAAREYAALGLRQMRLAAAAGQDVERSVAEKAGFRPAAVAYVRELDAAGPPAGDG